MPLSELADRFGAQCVMVAFDAKQRLAAAGIPVRA